MRKFILVYLPKTEEKMLLDIISMGQFSFKISNLTFPSFLKISRNKIHVTNFNSVTLLKRKNYIKYIQ